MGIQVVRYYKKISYLWGGLEESQRTKFKIIEESIDDANSSDKELVLDQGSDSYLFYTVIYENIYCQSVA